MFFAMIFAQSAEKKDRSSVVTSFVIAQVLAACALLLAFAAGGTWL